MSLKSGEGKFSKLPRPLSRSTKPGLPKPKEWTKATPRAAPTATLPSYMRATASSTVKKTQSVAKIMPKKKEVSVHSKLPSYMRPTASTKVKKTIPMGKRTAPLPQKSTMRKKTVKPTVQVKQVRKPATPVKPVVLEPSLKACKSAPRPKAKERQPIARQKRRTRFSVNKFELETQLSDWLKNETQLKDSSQVWATFAEETEKSARNCALLKTVEEMIDDVYALHLPHQEVWEALTDLQKHFPKVNIEMFSCYWKAKAMAAINIGQPQEKVFDLIQRGKKMNAQPPELLERFFEEVMVRYKNDPQLRDGRCQPDPELTLLPGLFITKFIQSARQTSL